MNRFVCKKKISIHEENEHLLQFLLYSKCLHNFRILWYDPLEEIDSIDNKSFHCQAYFFF